MKQLQQFERQDLEKMTPSLLVEIILRQQESIQQLFEEVARLKAIINRNSSDSSKPPSSDFLKKSEKAKAEYCPNCGGQSWIDIGVKTRQTARLVKNPIEIVEYQQHH